MKPFEDILPEEREKKQEELISLLWYAYQQEQRSSESEQQEALARVEKRLLKIEEDEAWFSETTPVRTISSYQFRPQNSLKPRKRIAHVFSALAAVLMVGVLIGGAVLLFALHQAISRPKSTSALAGAVSTPATAEVKWNGLNMSMSITPGPYFLGELLAIDFSLTNHTHKVLTLAGHANVGFCSPGVFSFVQRGGVSPNSNFTPVRWVVDCVTEPPGTPLVDGQTVTKRFYEPLASSGDVTLIGKAFFYASETNRQFNSDPLAEHFPTLHVHVMQQVPTDRVLSLHQASSSVMVAAPTGIHLLYQTYIICQGANSVSLVSGTGNDGWTLASANVVQRPQCAGISLRVVRWNYTVGAVGYEIVQGQQGKYSGPPFP